MLHEDTFDQLCIKTSEVIQILRDNDCNLSDDTYLDHLIIGIKDELLQHEAQSKRIDFWNRSNCSSFVESFESQNNESQIFILKLLKVVWNIHCDIQNQTIQIVCSVLKSFQETRNLPTQSFLDMLISTPK